MKKKSEEQVVQKFPYRCPYCDQPVSYDQFHLRTGENKIECSSCKKIYIKVVGDPQVNYPLPRREGNRLRKRRSR